MGILDLDLGISDIVDKIASYIPNDNERAKMKHDLEIKLKDHAHQLALEQIKTNQVEAAHSSLFKGGYRAAAGWTCSIGLAYGTIIQPIATWVAVVIFGYTGSVPHIDQTILIELLVGMLGLGAFRYKEKLNNVESK